MNMIVLYLKEGATTMAQGAVAARSHAAPDKALVIKS